MERVLRKCFPPENIPTKENTESFENADAKRENMSAKEKLRRKLVTLLIEIIRINGFQNRKCRIFYLEGERFKFSRAMIETLREFVADIPNFRGEDMEKAKLSQCSEIQNNCIVYGADSYNFLELCASFPLEFRPNYAFVWLDFCGPAMKERLQQIEFLFVPGMLLTDGISIVTTTFMTKLDTHSAINKDLQKQDIERRDNLLYRFTTLAEKHNYVIMGHIHEKNNGMMTMIYVLAPKAITTSKMFSSVQSTLLKVKALNLVTIPGPVFREEMPLEDFYCAASICAPTNVSRKREVSKAAKASKVISKQPKKRSKCAETAESDTYEVEKIIGQRVGKSNAIEYLVFWKGYSREDATWQTKEDLEGAPDALRQWTDQARSGRQFRRFEALDHIFD